MLKDIKRSTRLTRKILEELRDHTPFTVVGAFTGIILTIFFLSINLKEDTLHERV
jgi:hypothetical protein